MYALTTPTARQPRRRGDPSARSRVPTARVRAIQTRLLDWYDRNKRDLPWRRRAGDPYAQWVAEVMLQQTRVDTVMAYYDRFLRRFPTVTALASANDEAVLKAWEGLGYYRRVWHLHRAARSVHENGGAMPPDAEGLRTLPGVGDYTAAAVASIAYGEAAAAVDGNVARVIARLFGIEADVLATAGKAIIGGVAARLLPADRPGDFNQAWMDLGSALCTPRTPRCGECPFKALCVARRTDRAEALPIRGAGRNGRVASLTLLAGVFVDGDRVLMRRRSTGGLWSGLWETPNVEVGTDDDVHGLLRALAREGAARLNGSPRCAGVVHHRLTHRALTFQVYVVAAKANGELSRPPEPYRWASAAAMRRLSISTAHRRVLDAAGAAADTIRLRQVASRLVSGAREA